MRDTWTKILDIAGIVLEGGRGEEFENFHSGGIEMCVEQVSVTSEARRRAERVGVRHVLLLIPFGCRFATPSPVHPPQLRNALNVMLKVGAFAEGGELRKVTVSKLGQLGVAGLEGVTDIFEESAGGESASEM
jgi:hypothetical protein